MNKAKLTHAQKALAHLEDKEKRIQERIVSGKMKEELGDFMLTALYAQFQKCSEIITKLEKELCEQKERMGRLLSSLQTDITAETTDEEKAKYIQETISRIELTRCVKRGRMKGIFPTGFFVVTYKAGMKELYYYHSHRHTVWDKDMIPVEFEYIERFVSAPLKKSRARHKITKV